MASREQLSAGPPGLSGGGPVQVYRDLSRLLNTGLERYFDQQTFSDVTVVSPAGRKLRCHQLVLAACSRRFAAILEQGDFAGQDLPVQGVDADALELVLRFFYTGDCPISITSAVPLYDASTKLEVPGLATACEQFITQLLHPLTSIIFLEQALQLKMDLADMLLAYIRNRFEEVTSSDTFPGVAYDTMVKVLLDNKSRQQETALFKAASRWILADQKRVEAADEVFKLLNISSSTVQTLLQQNALQLIQQGTPSTANLTAAGSLAEPRTASADALGVAVASSGPMGVGALAGLGLGGAGGLGQGAGAGGLSLATLQGLPGLQLLPNGLVSFPALALQLQGQGLNAGEERRLGGGAGPDASKLAGLPSILKRESSDLQGLSGKVGPSRSQGQKRPPESPAKPDGGSARSAKSKKLGGAEDSKAGALGPASSSGGTKSLQMYTQPTDGENGRQAPVLPPPPSLKGVCHVDNCYADLTQLRDYHQRFKICDYHLKVSSIIKDGVPQRFCQQCGRFHVLSEFDGNKRSCRARLQRHNARRRKKAEMEAQQNPRPPGAAVSRSGGVIGGSSLSVGPVLSPTGTFLPMPLTMRDIRGGFAAAAAAALPALHPGVLAGLGKPPSPSGDGKSSKSSKSDRDGSGSGTDNDDALPSDADVAVGGANSELDAGPHGGLAQQQTEDEAAAVAGLLAAATQKDGGAAGQLVQLQGGGGGAEAAAAPGPGEGGAEAGSAGPSGEALAPAAAAAGGAGAAGGDSTPAPAGAEGTEEGGKAE